MLTVVLFGIRSDKVITGFLFAPLFVFLGIVWILKINCQK